MSGFQEIYETHSKAVYRFLLSLTRNEAMAEELLQETFYHALLHIDQFEGRSSLYTCLCQIGKNAWLKEYRKSKLTQAVSIDGLPELISHDSSPEEQLIHREEYLKIRSTILQLPEPYKDVFILRAYADIPLKEIARLYRKSESWARVTYFRARQKIIQEVTK